jgi:hypothetical protein
MIPVNEFNKSQCIKYDIIPLIQIKCMISVEKLNEIIVFIFKKYCKLSIYGYDVLTNKYWGKKITKECNLHFTLLINKNVDFSSTIIIDTICNKNNELNNLHNDIFKAIQIYNSSVKIE